MRQSKHTAQLVWGIALVLAGIGVIYRIPQVMPRIEELQPLSSVNVFARFSFYFLAVLLIGGGVKKIYNHYRGVDGPSGSQDSEGTVKRSSSRHENPEK